jgi:hypothetical protein
MSAVILKQLDAVEAQIEVLKVMVAAIRHTVSQPTARIERPETCTGYKAEDCARLSDEAAIEMGGMGGGPVTIMCRGCGAQQTR